MAQIIIRPYTQADRGSIREIAYETVFLGDSASVFFEGREIFADYLTAYFTDFEPQSCFVAQAGDKIIGYLLGAKNSAILKTVFRRKIIPGLLVETVTDKTLFSIKNTKFLLNCLRSFFKGEFKLKDYSKEYPAVLHINIQNDFRSRGIGSELIKKYLHKLIEQKVKGVHFATLSDKAAKFFQKCGFTLLEVKKRSYFRYILHKNLKCYIFGKKFEY